MPLLRHISVAFYRSYNMNKIAIIGCGNHVIKNILPVFDKLKWEIKYIFVRNIEKYRNLGLDLNFVDNICDVLNDDSVDFIYIATPISTHYQYSKQALAKGRNVICEKPITVTTAKLDKLYQIAKETNCNLYQVEMYKYHKQFQKLKEVLNSGVYGELKQASLSFKIPHLSPMDIRYDPAQAGGALYDVGFYPISAAVSLFPTAQLEYSTLRSAPGYKVDLQGTALFSVGEQALIHCQWSIGNCYENKIVLEFSTHRVVAERAFSKPSSLITNIQVYSSNGDSEIIEIGCDDHFFNMFSYFLSRENLYFEIDKTTKKTIEVLTGILHKNRTEI